MKAQRGLVSTILSSITYDFIFYTLSGLIAFVGIAAATSLYLVSNPLSSDAEFARMLTEFPELNFVFKSYQNFTFLMVILGIATYLVSRIVKKHILGEQTALLWQIEKIKNGEFDQKRSLRKNDQSQNVMLALHELADYLSKKSNG